MELAMEVFFVVILPMLMCVFALLQIILKLKKRVKELEAALEKERQEKNPEN